MLQKAVVTKEKKNRFIDNLMWKPITIETTFEIVL